MIYWAVTLSALLSRVVCASMQHHDGSVQEITDQWYATISMQNCVWFVSTHTNRFMVYWYIGPYWFGLTEFDGA